MNPAEAAELLTLAATFDHRKPDRAAALAWSAALQGVRFDDAQAAVIDHYRAEHRWIMPSDVLKGVRRIALARADSRANMDIPAELEAMEDGPEFTAAYLEWQRTGQVPQGQLTA